MKKIFKKTREGKYAQDSGIPSHLIIKKLVAGYLSFYYE